MVQNLLVNGKTIIGAAGMLIATYALPALGVSASTDQVIQAITAGLTFIGLMHKGVKKYSANKGQ